MLKHTGAHTCTHTWCVLLAQCLKNSPEDKQSQKERRPQLFLQLVEQHGCSLHPACSPRPHREMGALPTDLALLVLCPAPTLPCLHPGSPLSSSGGEACPSQAVGVRSRVQTWAHSFLPQSQVPSPRPRAHPLPSPSSSSWNSTSANQAAAHNQH